MSVPAAAPLLLCIGDIDMDIILKVPRRPGRDEKVDGVRIGQTPGGMAANVAVGASRLGTRSRILGTVGEDTMGREVIAALMEEDLDLNHVVRRPDAATFFCVIMVDEDGEKSLVKVVSPAYLPRPRDLTPDVFIDVSHVHLTFTVHELAEPALALARRSGASVSLDLEAADIPPGGGRIAELVRAADLLFVSEPSRHAIEGLTGPLSAADDKTVVTTRGSDGARLERGARRLEVPGHSVAITDTSGAGDAFAAAFLHCRLNGADDLAALRFANAAAALSTRAYGAQAGMPGHHEVEEFLENREGDGSYA